MRESVRYSHIRVARTSAVAVRVAHTGSLTGHVALREAEQASFYGGAFFLSFCD